ncbi:TolC family protein [Flavobacterium oreochromis]|uniref:TolC family protein n=1 Tax=Flavobacterium oreochromis TaxID=2906078 RepID=A0ABW8PAC4_9FLAO|nr:TolC family protein [Flavobacterium oreochromis]OWP74138.1 hypothetical protein BWG23_14860 [Flavobacterium oreochromis]
MIKSAKVIVFITVLLNLNILFSQNIHTIDINHGLKLLELNSEEFKQINRNSEIEKLKFKIYENSFLPRADLGLSIPSYKRSINSITQPNGENKFIEQSQATSNLNLNISQVIPFTGGEIRINSSIDRLDNLTKKAQTYSSSWFNVLLNQPLNGYNQFKWGKKVNSLKFRNNNLERLKVYENKKRTFIDNYFETYINNYKINLTKKNIEITQQYLSQLEKLVIEGRVLESDILKAKLSLSQLNYKLISDKLNYSISINDLKNDMGITKNDSLILVEPQVLAKPNIFKEDLREKFSKYAVDIEYEYPLLESAQKLAKAKSEKGVQINLQVGYGLNSNNDDISYLYNIPSKREYLNFSINVPIVNWNENSKNYKIQELFDQNIRGQYETQKKKINDNVENLINSINGLYEQIEYSEISRKIAAKNSEIATNLLIMKRLTINDFNQEIFKEEKEFVDYLSSNKSIWLFKYYLRKTTLFDFFENKNLISE